MRAALTQQCKDYLQHRIQRLKKSIQELESDLEGETKSSAGDKYETSREMMNAEINKLQQQLQEFRKLEEVLAVASQRKVSENIQLGSIVTTNLANYFLAIPVGELKFQTESYYGIGINSPIGKLMLGKTKGDTVFFQQQEIKIESVN
ncbi:MAG: transcription elongation factor [Mesonia sp.]|nr:transcription elongation factor [Mesonia sp.]MAQ41282.1 transcription elongation factor [Mesonia sp.]MBJ97381.1 transcription elongation factor [Flavobacteriaceae bacterium]